MSSNGLSRFPSVSVSDLSRRLGFKSPVPPPPAPSGKELRKLSMDEDDSLILRWLFKSFRPSRHLEFGTWQGKGVMCCLEECDATVWTLNPLEGEKDESGGWAYSSIVADLKRRVQWARTKVFTDPKGGPLTYYQTDALGMIGRYYLNADLGRRVCQIYADSRRWDISNYPDGFFDTVLIDGGHQEDVVLNDTRKALRLLRPGGLLLWHDFCQDAGIVKERASVRGVVRAVENNRQEIEAGTADLFWIDPSLLLVGVRK